MPVSDNSTKRCLDIVELLDAIVEQCDLKTRRNMATTAKSFEITVRRVLWRNLYGLLPLLASLPKDAVTVGAYNTIQPKEELSQEDWERVAQKLVCVRQFTVLDLEMTGVYGQLVLVRGFTYEKFVSIARRWGDEKLFPNLQVLRILQTSRPDNKLESVFEGYSFTALHYIIDCSSGHDFGGKGLAKLLTHSSLSLRTLRVILSEEDEEDGEDGEDGEDEEDGEDGEDEEDGEEAEWMDHHIDDWTTPPLPSRPLLLSAAIDRLKSLACLTSYETPFHPDCWVRLTQLPQLQTLVVHFSDDLISHGAAIHAQQTLCFSSLVHLCFCIHDGNVVAMLATLSELLDGSNYPRLQSFDLRFHTTPPPEVDIFLPLHSPESMPMLKHTAVFKRSSVDGQDMFREEYEQLAQLTCSLRRRLGIESQLQVE